MPSGDLCWSAGWMLIVSYPSQHVSHFLCECLAGILEIRTVSEGGILAIKGIKSQYYIAMNKAGQLQGKVIFFLMKEKNHMNCFQLVHNQAS